MSKLTRNLEYLKEYKKIENVIKGRFPEFDEVVTGEILDIEKTLLNVIDYLAELGLDDG